MKPARSLALAVAAAMLLVLPALAQDEGPAVTVVPNDQFCNLVADDLAACEQALATLASAGMLPEAFAGLLTGAGEEGPGPESPGAPVVIRGKGGITGSKPFDLAGGDYEVTLKTNGPNCDSGGWYLRRAEDDYPVESFEQSGYLYAVEGGRHFIKVIATDKCNWTVTISPLSE